MKFSYQLAYNAFAPWAEQYVDYKRLKKSMKQQRREQVKNIDENWKYFESQIVYEINKFTRFFSHTLSELEAKLRVSSLQGSRKLATEMYLELSELKKFIFLNAEGSRKLVKKFDKLNGTNHETEFISSCRGIQEMLNEQKSIDASLDILLALYAETFTENDLDAASALLSQSLTDLVHWDKGTIWNDLLRLDRNKSSKNIVEKSKTSTLFFFANIAVIFLSALAYFQILSHLPFHAARCLAVLILVSGWWSLGTFPLFVSALAVPLLVVVADVLPVPSRAEAAHLVLSHMWTGSQGMVLASFALAAALSKLRLDKQLACVIITVIKNGRKKIMFSLMLIGWSSSFAIGNMASSVLCLSLAVPVIDELPQLDPSTAEYAKNLLIAIAFACNFGGMTSPVASPQNIIAFASLQKFKLTFTQWVLVAVPTSFILLICTFLFLMPPRHISSSLSTPLITRTNNPTLPRWNMQQEQLPPRITDAILRKNFHWDSKKIAVVTLLVFAALLWMATSLTANAFGDVGLASLLPLLLVFALPGVLNKSDFLSMPWDVCLLLAAGGVLALAVSQSELLTIAGQAAAFHLSMFSPVSCQIIACLFVTIVSTGVSHTAAANVLMPFIVELGTGALGPSNALRFILPVSLCLSAGMALPISSCPNMNATAICKSSDQSVPWVKPTDYLWPGLVLSFLSVALFVFVADPLTSFVCTC